MSSTEPSSTSSSSNTTPATFKKPAFITNIQQKDPALLPDCSKLAWDEAKKTAISRNQWRKQKRIAEKLEKRPAKRLEERERRKAHRKVEKENGTFQPKPRKYRMSESTNKQRVVIDLSFPDVSLFSGKVKNL